MAGELIKSRDVLKIGQRIDFYVGDDEARYASRIEGINQDELVVSMPNDRHGVPIIPRTGERLLSMAKGESCRYRFFTTYKGSEKLEGHLPVWHIDCPEQVERFQNRQFVRVDVNLPVKVRLVAEDGSISKAISTRTVDLSGNGICFVMNEPVKSGMQAALEINDILETGTIDVMSRVIRSRLVSGEGEKPRYHVGAEFEFIARATSNKIVHYVFAEQRKMLAKGIINK